MPNRKRRLPLACLGAASLALLPLAGCVTHHHHYAQAAPGPAVVVGGPPITLANGGVYHYLDHDVTLVFDAGWGGYWVRDYPDHYYRAGHYYWRHAGRWHRAVRPTGPWVVVGARSLPGRLDRHCVRIARHEANETWRDAVLARREAQRDRREERHEAKQDAREERRDAKQDAREERHDAKQEQRAERQEARQENRAERHEAREERRDERTEARAERHEARQEQRDDRPKKRRRKPKPKSVPASPADDDEQD